jgi:uncharacterized cupin superfamily protein
MLTIDGIRALPGVAHGDPTQLERWGPPSHVIAGRPETRGINAFSSRDGSFSTGVWEGTPGKWRIHFAEDELCVLLSGKVVVTDQAGAQRTFVAGDAFVIPAGFLGTWEVVETARKVYAIHEMPAA